MLPIISYLIIGVLYDILIMIPAMRQINKEAMKEESEENTFSTTIILILTAPIIYPFITIYATCIIIKRLFKKFSYNLKQTKLYVAICDYFYIRY
jgi:hypothetical protein